MSVCVVCKKEKKKLGKGGKREVHIPEKPAQARGVEDEICSY